MQFKTRSVNTVTVFALVVTLTLGGLFAPVASAQVLANPILVKVPFAFSVGPSKLPAGTYLIVRASASVIRFVNKSTQKSVFSLVSGGETKFTTPPPQVVFHRYGEKYFLAKIWDGTNTTAHELRTSTAEREAARQMGSKIAQANSAPMLVTIIAEPRS